MSIFHVDNDHDDDNNNNNFSNNKIAKKEQQQQVPKYPIKKRKKMRLQKQM
jgi:hypothetical protein